LLFWKGFKKENASHKCHAFLQETLELKYQPEKFILGWLQVLVADYRTVYHEPSAGKGTSCDLCLGGSISRN